MSDRLHRCSAVNLIGAHKPHICKPQVIENSSILVGHE
jgi:hypothetical protein